ncbi:DMT family transporter [Aliigemmobacter aestuarii]|uniref:DMT family transporter n=1 Tax=Aliigemmobacter aestuarii TaxID=1445661 RepID=A0A4S3MTA1_9RHOB|nr:DMT family transporter [Gemmobacter aestuarii]THD85353.1 DMT family transporter [Gemmobacter aestuarii]
MQSAAATSPSQAGGSLGASLVVLACGVFWGFYWLPVRALDDLGLTGPLGTAAIAAAAAILLVPSALAGRRRLWQCPPVVLLSVALGGAAFALYSVGLVYGRVAIIVLLYFLTPVWSTLIARFVLGWETTRMRLLAMAVGLTGLAVMLGAGGQAPLPQGAGEWMSLIAGLLWSVSTTGIRVRSALAPTETSFVFALGAALTALALWPFLPAAPLSSDPAEAWRIVAIALGTAALWWVLSILGLMWAVARLEPARVGILLMAEVLVGSVTAAVLAGEHLSPAEIAGGVLVLLAGLIEIASDRRGRVVKA